MPEPDLRPFKVAIVWRGDARARAEARPETSRFHAVFAALERHGIAAEPAVWSDALTGEVRAQLLGMDGVLVWVDPIAAATGERRGALDELLREVADAGVFVSCHPDVTAKMGVKAVLYRTRGLGWGTETYLYETYAVFTAEFPGRVAGFGHQLVRALAPPEAGLAGPRLYSGPDDGRFQRLRALLEQEWVPQMARLLVINPDALPVIWDADFLLGPKTPAGEDTYVLCEINVSSVYPFPDEALEPLADHVAQRLGTPARL